MITSDTFNEVNKKAYTTHEVILSSSNNGKQVLTKQVFHGFLLNEDVMLPEVQISIR
jgi:hypothetical protein